MNANVDTFPPVGGYGAREDRLLASGLAGMSYDEFLKNERRLYDEAEARVADDIAYVLAADERSKEGA